MAIMKCNGIYLGEYQEFVRKTKTQEKPKANWIVKLFKFIKR